MNSWITNWKKIKIKVKQILRKQPAEQEATDWKTCPQCKKISYKPDLFANSYICGCSFHFDLPPKLRLDSLFDSTYEIIEAPDNVNPEFIYGKLRCKDDPSGFVSTSYVTEDPPLVICKGVPSNFPKGDHSFSPVEYIPITLLSTTNLIHA